MKHKAIDKTEALMELVTHDAIPLQDGTKAEVIRILARVKQLLSRKDKPA
ncbi:hypothetical protein O1D18_001081 [Vibrio cholerae]|nr:MULTISPECIES: hypothetical protein [Vibrio]EKF9797527.1 hypothetical protein [Vibrio cholerae]KNH58052.1 hypothetical protein A55_1865 [Vibrio cholerae 1587]MCO7065190.1 hypothetical protein [Vibrio paracholerae]MEB5538573.1 hypothetical protein [Vibrio cholerae]MEB5547208.1 hypothetical protein [Vibrio cholerae]